jgi:hypothetical protein
VNRSQNWPDPAQRDRLVEIRDNLVARIIKAKREGWLRGTYLGALSEHDQLDTSGSC